ncbi:MAG: branched-chain amino acid ABC transporter permease [Bacteroidota bacterium]
MDLLFSGYFIHMLSFILMYTALATILHIQFGLTGIVNFGIAGFWGFGMYACLLIVLNFNIPYFPAVILASVLTGIISMLLGRIILNLEPSSVLVATLAFHLIVEFLIISEKWLTGGVLGGGPVGFPFDLGRYNYIAWFLLIFLLTAILMFYAGRLGAAPYGRLLIGIQDNEPLAQSLGKPTFRQKTIIFTFTSALAGLFGAITVPLYTYLFPKFMGPELTFTIWIALILGSQKRLFGGLVGILVTIGFFDIIVEALIPIPVQYVILVASLKYVVYGLTLMLVLMFRPSGILGTRDRSGFFKNTGKLEKKEG